MENIVDIEGVFLFTAFKDLCMRMFVHSFETFRTNNN